MSMQAVTVAAIAAAALALPVHAAGESIGVDPNVGATGTFSYEWQPAYGYGPLVADTWKLSPTQDQWIQFRLRDLSYPGDNFTATVNGAAVSWDHYTPGVGGRDSEPPYQWADGQVRLLLHAGTTYTLGFVPAPCGVGCSTGGGGTYWITPVPEGSTVAFMIAGLVLLAALRGKRLAGALHSRQSQAATPQPPSLPLACCFKQDERTRLRVDQSNRSRSFGPFNRRPRHCLLPL